tara:strand:+ start:3183 stop:3506 length:324 start_codon:yes stop_codon:yes gene_type:complete
VSIEALLVSTVDIQTPTATRDNSGGYEESWANSIVNMPCRIQPVGGNEAFSMGKEGAEISHRVYCVPANITESDRIIFGSRTFRIRAVRDTDELGRLMVIDCIEESS